MKTISNLKGKVPEVHRNTPASRFFLRSQDDWKFWVAIAFLAKGFLFLLLIHQGRPTYVAGAFGNFTTDTHSYLDPIDHLVRYGEYHPDYRMPGYGSVYLPLIVLFSKPLACNILILLQLIAASVATYVLALTAVNCFQRHQFFHIVFYVYCISSYTNLYDTFLLSDSFCVSASIFAVYFLTSYLRQRKRKDIFWSGVFLTWTIFLRPMFLPLIVLFLLIVLLDWVLARYQLKELIRNAVILLVFFVVIDAVWTTRNYLVHHRIAPLTTSLYALDFENSYLRELMDFVNAWGGDRSWWNGNSEMRWFGVGLYLKFPAEKVTLPSDIYTSAFTIDSLQQIKKYIAIIEQASTPESTKADLTRLVKKKLADYTLSVKEEKKFLYYVKAPMRLFKRFFVHSGTYNLFHKAYPNLNVAEKSVKLFYSSMYWLILISGACGIISLTVSQFRSPLVMLIVGMTLYSVLLFPIILRQIEYRYFLPAFPFLLMLACYFGRTFFEAVQLWQRKRNVS